MNADGEYDSREGKWHVQGHIIGVGEASETTLFTADSVPFSSSPFRGALCYNEGEKNEFLCRVVLELLVKFSGGDVRLSFYYNKDSCGSDLFIVTWNYLRPT